MMMKWMISIFVVLLLFIPSLGAGDWNATYHDFQNTSSTNETGPAPPFQIIWKHLMIGGDYGDNNDAPLVHGNYVYDETKWALTAYNRTTGKVIWTKNVGGETDLIYHNGVIYAINGYIPYYVYAFDAATGKILWHRNWKWYHFISHEGIIWKGYLLLVSSERVNNTKNETSFLSLYFIDLNSGVIKKDFIFDSYPIIDPYVSVCYWKGNLYVESYKYAYGINLTDMKVMWKIPVNAWGYIRANIVVGHNKVFMSEQINTSKMPYNGILALNAFTGKKIWEKVTGYGAEFGTMFYYSPIYDEIFTLVKGKTIRDVQDRPLTLYNLTAINGTTGKVVWATRDKDWAFWTVSIVPTRRYLYVDAMGKSPKSPIYGSELLRIYNITNGKLVYSFAIHSYGELGDSYFQYPQISVSDGMIYIPDNGMLYAIGTGEYKGAAGLEIYGLIGTVIVIGVAIILLVHRRRNT